ncbi:MAG: SPFH domain-containing protein [Bacilli bacterium]|nr:SPFH/Band 7/PHB domain protein [Bacillales bacterium]MDD7382094.1 SPFH/Band 7/PHB domain protein [Bacillales bacterium]MDY2746113.1 SPFH domain-containing protein [Bacilli bacterium]MDY3889909.1 SPFH domain-containing protein [Bacilli bacterium]
MFLMSPGGIFGIIALVIVAIAIIVVIIRSIVIVPQATIVIVQRLGKYARTLPAGIHILTPIIEKKVQSVSLKEKVADFPPQPVITKDNVTMQIDTVVYFQITDPKLYTYGVERPMQAIENLTATTLRNLIGDLELDQTLTSRDTINQQMRMILDEATDPWGIKVNRVELKNILPPKDIQEAMEKQMRAERQKREAILKADGEKQAAILSAEGEKEAAILRAEAKRVSMVTEAEGQAEALLKVYQAQAEGIKAINDANPSAAYLTLKGYEALEKVANTDSAKIIIPSEISNVSGLITSMKEVVNVDLPQKKSTK